MARIIIEIKDNIADSVQKKIRQIGDTAVDAEKSIKFLETSIKTLSDSTNSYLGVSERFVGMETKRANALRESTRFLNEQNKALDEKLSKEKALNDAINNAKEIAKSNALRESTRYLKEYNQSLDERLIKERKLAEAILIQSRANTPTGRIESASEKLRALNLNVGGASDGFNESARLQKMVDSYKDLDNSVKKTNSSLFTFHNLFVAFAVIRVADKIVGIIDSYTLMQNRLQLVSESLEQTKNLQSEMFNIANEARVPVEQLTQSFVRYDYALRALGASQRESLQFTKTLTQTLQISGLTTAESSSALLQLSQALNKGKLDGDEFRTIMETLPTLATAIAKEMGVARGELIRLAPQGKITASIIRDAMAAIADDTEVAFSKLAPTIGQSLTVARNQIIQDIGKLNEVTGASGKFAEGILFVSKNLDSLAVGATAAAGVLLFQLAPATTVATAAVGRFALATGALIKSPFFVYAALAIGVYKGLEYAITGNLDAIEAETEANNKKADEFEKAQGIKARALKYETEAHIKLRQEYDKYLALIEENKRGVLLKLITNETAAILEEESAIGKLIMRAKEYAEFGLKTLVDSKKLEKDVYENEKYGNKLISDLQANARIQKEIVDNSLKDFEKSAKREQSIRDKIAKDRKAGDYTQGISDLPEKAIKKEIEIRNKLQDVIDTESARLKTSNDLIKEATKTRDANTEAIKREFFAKENLKIEEEYSKAIADKYDFEIQKIRQVRDERIKSLQEQIKLGLITADSAIYNEIMINRIALNGLEENEKARQESFQKELDRGKELALANKKINDEMMALEEKEQEKKRKDFSDNISRKISLILDLQNSLAPEKSASEKIIDEGARRQEILDELMQLQIGFIDEDIANTKRGEEEKTRIVAYFNGLRKLNTTRTTEETAEEEKALALRRVSTYAEMFGAFSNLADVFAENSGKNAKEMFLASKALAGVEAILNMAVAISAANKEGDLGIKVAKIAIASAVGAAQIATITSTAIKGYANGAVNIGGSGTSTSDSMLAYIGRGESVINSRSTARHRSLLEAINDDTGTSSSINNTYVGGNSKGSAPTINIINNTGGEIKQTGSYNAETNTMDIMLDQIETKLAQKYADGNGKLAKAIDGKRLRNY